MFHLKEFSQLSTIPLPSHPSRKADALKVSVESTIGADGAELFCRVWRGLVGHGVLLYLHGIEGHSQWFEPTASVLNERGLTIFAPDRRGSGLNQENRGHLSSFRTYVADVETNLSNIARQYPGEPIFLLANCWSAKAATLIAEKNHVYANGAKPVKLSGLVLTCPAIATRVNFDFLTKLKIAWCAHAGDKSKKTLWRIPLTAEMLTENERFLDYLRRDPLRLKYATARFFRETFLLGLLASSSCKRIELPLLILQAAQDRIVEVSKIRKWYEKVPAQDKQWHIFEEATHSLEFDELNFEKYTSILGDWLSQKIKTGRLA